MSLALAAAPPATAAGTVALQLVSLVNQARASLGLIPLRLDPRITLLTEERARRLAVDGVLSHSAAGDIGAQLDSRGVRWYRYGEVLAWQGGSSGIASAIFQRWRNSPTHWVLLMSSQYNYLGAGTSISAQYGATFASIVLVEQADRTAPIPRMVGATRYSTTIRWTYKAWEPPLQTHTAGLKDFDVAYRVDRGSWRIIRSGTTATYVRLTGRARGHSYSVSVRARDRRGNVSAWTPELRVWVP